MKLYAVAVLLANLGCCIAYFFGQYRTIDLVIFMCNAIAVLGTSYWLYKNADRKLI